MHSLLKKCQKTQFLNGISSKIFNFQIILYLIDVYQYHTSQKNSPKNSINNHTFKVHILFSNSMMGIIWSQICSIHSNSSMFVGIFKIID